MITHPAESRGHADHGRLKGLYTFSFADYYDPKRMGFGTLRVINDDSLAPGAGFETHFHHDMEILSIPLQGQLAHRDSEGHSSIIKEGEIQIMSAGTGINHSEFNASDEEEMKFLQIWILPKKIGLKPHYEQRRFNFKDNDFTLLVSPDGGAGSLKINQDAFFTMARASRGTGLIYERKHGGNGLYVLVLDGEIEGQGHILEAQDGMGLEDFSSYRFMALEDSEVLLMEVPMI